MKKKNRGYTLGELIVAIAILAVVGIGIGTMVSQSLKQYRASNAEVNLQQESQLVGNQLMNLVIDANDGVSAETGKLNIYRYDATNDMHSKTVISYDANERELKLNRYEADGADGAWIAVESETDECMAEYVTSFTVNLLDENGNRVITIADRGDCRVSQVEMKISYELNGMTYDFNQTITLRNQVLASNITAGVWEDETPDTEDSETPDTENSETEDDEDVASGQVRIYLTRDGESEIDKRYYSPATLHEGEKYWFHIEAYDEKTEQYQELDWNDEINAGHIYAFTKNSGNTIENKETYVKDGYIQIKRWYADKKTYELVIRYNGDGLATKDDYDCEEVYTISVR